MKRLGPLVFALSTIALSACDSNKTDVASADRTEVAQGEADAAPAAQHLARRVHAADCQSDLLPSLGLASDFSIARSVDTAAGCELAGSTQETAEVVMAKLSDALSREGYSLRDSVDAKGGTRLSFVSPDGLAVSALVRSTPLNVGGEGEVQSARLDLHWYDPARLED